MRSPAGPASVSAGFARPAWDSQAVFRRVLEAMSHPGRVAELPVALEAPEPLNLATAAVCLTLFDYETAVWLQPVPGLAAVEAYLRFHCGCPLVTAPEKADFAVMVQPKSAPTLGAFEQGLAEQPHRSASLIFQVPSLERGPALTLRGPGIAERHTLRVDGLPAGFWEQWRRNGAKFPLGVDAILTSGSRLAALPRTVQAEP